MVEITVSCASCQAEYVLPEGYRQHLEGRAVFCVDCQRWWVALPSSSGPPVKLVKGRPERAPIDLRPFRRGASAPAAPQAPATPQASSPAAAASPAGGLDSTARVPVSSAAAPSLRVVVSTPGKEVKAVFALGSKSFLIGQQQCHLNLKQAAIPAKAIRVLAEGRGFRFEGVDGFQIPIGSMSIGSGQIAPGGSVGFELAPYKILLEISATPGRPIADLEGSGVPGPASQPVAPQPAVPQPAAPQPPAPQPPAPQPPAQPPLAQPSPPAHPQTAQMPGLPATPAVDLRQQVQELAVEVRPDQQAFAEQQAAVQEVLDGDATITDLGAQGFQATRFGNPLAGLDLSLVCAEGPMQGQAFKITKSPVVIGRKEGDMIVHDGRVSSKHAQLDIAGARIYTVKDLASTNGTTVNDRPISVGHLQDGDVISFGGVKFEFRAKQTG